LALENVPSALENASLEKGERPAEAGLEGEGISHTKLTGVTERFL